MSKLDENIKILQECGKEKLSKRTISLVCIYLRMNMMGPGTKCERET